jgi:hypothetical protein
MLEFITSTLDYQLYIRILTILLFGLLMAAIFTLLLISQYLLGFNNSARNESGDFDMRRSPIGILMVVFVFSLIIGIPVLANTWLTTELGKQSWLSYFMVAYGIFFFTNLWDLIVFDYILIIRFRPSFIKLPDTSYYTTMQPHIKGWFRGLVIGLLTSFMAATISIWLL